MFECEFCGSHHQHVCYWTSFQWCLSELKVRKGQLADRLGVSPSSVSRWGNDAPQYAMAYLHERLKRQMAADRLEGLIIRFQEDSIRLMRTIDA